MFSVAYILLNESLQPFLKILSTVSFFIAVVVVSIVFNVHLIATTILILSGLFIVFADMAIVKEANYKKGISAEIAVEKLLGGIPGIYVYRDLTLGKEDLWDIDFVIVSQGGIFVLEVKAYEGRITADNDVWYQHINGKRRVVSSFSKQARGNALMLRKYLEAQLLIIPIPFITPIVVLTNPFSKEDVRNDKNKTLVAAPEEIRNIVLGDRKLDSDKVVWIVSELDKLGSRL